MPITVPPLPSGYHPAACWRRTLTGLNPAERGGRCVTGEWLHATDTVDLPAGTLVLAVDKQNTGGWETNYKTGDRYPLEDATVTVYLADADGLTQLWTRHYKRAASAFGATTLKKLGALLDEHPAPGGEITVVREARRPNDKSGTCPWCSKFVPAVWGHVAGHGEDAHVEHYEDCPPRPASTGETCALCGVVVIGIQAQQHLVREGSGRWETRHRVLHGMSCTESPIASPEEQQEQAEERKRAAAKAAEKARQAEERKAARKQAAKDKKRAEHDAEQARVAGLATTGRTSRELYDKGLGGSMRVRLLEHTDALEDGTTTMRWSVETYGTSNGFNGEDYDPDPSTDTPYTELADARAAYQSLKFEPAPRARWREPSGEPCANCDGPGGRFRRVDSSGIGGVVCASCDKDDDFQLSFA